MNTIRNRIIPGILSVVMAAAMAFATAAPVFASESDVNTVKEMIAALPTDLGSITEDNKEAIDTAAAAYNALSPEDQATIDGTNPPDSAQSYGRVLESACWVLWSLDAIDNSTTLPDGTYVAPSLSYNWNKGKTSLEEPACSVASVTVSGGTSTAVLEVSSADYSKIYLEGKEYERTNDEGVSPSRFEVPIKLGAPLYFAGYTTSMSCYVAYCITAEVEAPETVHVDFTSQKSGKYLHAPQFGYEVASDEAEKFGYTDSVNDGVSVLDVLVSAHELYYGDAFTSETANDYLTVDSSGSPTMQFETGYATAPGGFFLNHAMANDGTKRDPDHWNGTTVGTQEVKEGDLVEFFFYEESGNGDTYNWFVDGESHYSRSFQIVQNQDLKLKLKGFSAIEASCFKDADEMTSSDKPDKVAAAQIFTVDPESGVLSPIEDAVTDESGIVTLSFPNAGTYTITAFGTLSCTHKQILSLTTVTVEEPLAMTNNVEGFLPESVSVSGDEGAYVLHLTMQNMNLDRVFAGYNYDATEETSIAITDMNGKGTVNVPVSDLSEPIVLAFRSADNEKYYNRTLTIDLNGKTAVYDPTEISIEQLDAMTTEQAVERAADLTSVDLVNRLIEAIWVQERDENTDKHCTLAKAYYDALSDEDKEKLEDPDYFGKDTGDASADDPRNKDNIGEKELLVISFGTSYNGSRVKDIKAVEEALAKAYPDYAVRRAFMSQIILNHIQARDGEVIDNMQQAFERAVANGVKELIVQPTHVISGTEYNEMCEAVDAYKNKFEKVIIGKPLLNSDADKVAVAEAAVDAALKDAGIASVAAADSAKTALVFVGHGTDDKSKETYTQMQEIFDGLGYKNVFVGTVEGEPEATAVNKVLAKVQAKGCTKVILRPLMLVAGDHAYNDMAGSGEDSWKSIFSAALGGDNVTCQLAGLGEIEDVQKLYVSHVKEAIDPRAESTVTLKAKTAVYTGKAIAIGKAVVTGSTGNVVYKYFTDAKCTKAVKSAVNVGTYYVTATVAGDLKYKPATSAPVKLTITKAKNKMTAKGKTIKASASKKKTFKKAKAFTIKKATGKVTFKQVTKNKLISVQKNGKVVIKKGLKAGKLYKITVKVTAKGNGNVKPVTKKAILKVKVGK